MKKQLSIKLLGLQDFNKILELSKQLNPTLNIETLRLRLESILKNSSYKCFGLHEEDNLIGLTGCWTTVRLYSGKQLELDNVIIDPKLQSNGYGKYFFTLIQQWATENNYETIELNTYLVNYRSHKFYFNQGFKVLGFHFQKHI